MMFRIKRAACLIAALWLIGVVQWRASASERISYLRFDYTDDISANLYYLQSKIAFLSGWIFRFGKASRRRHSGSYAD